MKRQADLFDCWCKTTKRLTESTGSEDETNQAENAIGDELTTQ